MCPYPLQLQDYTSVIQNASQSLENLRYIRYISPNTKQDKQPSTITHTDDPTSYPQVTYPTVTRRPVSMSTCIELVYLVGGGSPVGFSAR